jgi:ATP-dependent Clp endopeptidase proteolytic subunit ClpP
MQAEIVLNTVIGQGDLFEPGTTAKDFLGSLTKATGGDKQTPLNIIINSPGGNVHDGLEMYNALREYANSTAVIVGVAASAASFVAMGAARVAINRSAQLMIHLPKTGVYGNATEVQQTAEALEKMGQSIAEIYVAKTGLPKEIVMELMAAETWMTAEEALAMGFVDEIREHNGAVTRDSRLAPAALYSQSLQVKEKVVARAQTQAEAPIKQLPAIYNQVKQQLNNAHTMDNKEIEAETAKVNELQAQLSELKKQNETLANQLKQAEQTQIKDVLDTAEKLGKFSASERTKFEGIAQKGLDNLKAVLDVLPAKNDLTLSALIDKKTELPKGESAKTFDQLWREDPQALLKLKEQNPAEYQRLYENHFGMAKYQNDYKRTA